MSKVRPKWNELGKALHPSILKVLKDLRFKTTTPVQVNIPQFLT